LGFSILLSGTPDDPFSVREADALRKAHLPSPAVLLNGDKPQGSSLEMTFGWCREVAQDFWTGRMSGVSA
jgi:hypothetical protein